MSIDINNLPRSIRILEKIKSRCIGINYQLDQIPEMIKNIEKVCKDLTNLKRDCSIAVDSAIYFITKYDEIQKEISESKEKISYELSSPIKSSHKSVLENLRLKNDDNLLRRQMTRISPLRRSAEKSKTFVESMIDNEDVDLLRAENIELKAKIDRYNKEITDIGYRLADSDEIYKSQELSLEKLIQTSFQMRVENSHLILENKKLRNANEELSKNLEFSQLFKQKFESVYENPLMPTQESAKTRPKIIFEISETLQFGFKNLKKFGNLNSHRVSDLGFKPMKLRSEINFPTTIKENSNIFFGRRTVELQTRRLSGIEINRSKFRKLFYEPKLGIEIGVKIFISNIKKRTKCIESFQKDISCFAKIHKNRKLNIETRNLSLFPKANPPIIKRNIIRYDLNHVDIYPKNQRLSIFSQNSSIYMSKTHTFLKVEQFVQPILIKPNGEKNKTSINSENLSL